jgi:hypothetical protein
LSDQNAIHRAGRGSHRAPRGTQPARPRQIAVHPPPHPERRTAEQRSGEIIESNAETIREIGINSA